MSARLQPKYNETRATQAAALLIKLEGGAMNYTKLIKLLYLADREALINRGRPITFASYASLDKGPVLSETLNKIKKPGTPRSYWDEHIETCGYLVRVLDDCPQDELSKSEQEFLQQVFARYGHLELWNELIDQVMHDLPEWRNPNGSSLSIDYEDILRAGGVPEPDIDAIEDELESIRLMDDLIAEFSS